MAEGKARSSRRNFLLAVGAGSAASAAALMSKAVSTAPAPPIGDDKKNLRYRLTDHVRNYYRTAKI